MSRFCLILFMLLALGCGSPEKPVTNGTNALDDSGLFPISHDVVYAQGWTEVIVNANYAKTTIGVGAHFNTTRNACGKDAYGAINLVDWNGLSKGINSALQLEPLQEEYCMPAPELEKSMDGSVEVKITEKNRTLLEYKGGEVCTNIPDRTLSKDLLDVVNRLVLVADKEDCPHGWGTLQ